MQQHAEVLSDAKHCQSLQCQSSLAIPNFIRLLTKWSRNVPGDACTRCPVSQCFIRSCFNSRKAIGFDLKIIKGKGRQANSYRVAGVRRHHCARSRRAVQYKAEFRSRGREKSSKPEPSPDQKGPSSCCANAARSGQGRQCQGRQCVASSRRQLLLVPLRQERRDQACQQRRRAAPKHLVLRGPLLPLLLRPPPPGRHAFEAGPPAAAVADSPRAATAGAAVVSFASAGLLLAPPAAAPASALPSRREGATTAAPRAYSRSSGRNPSSCSYRSYSRRRRHSGSACGSTPVSSPPFGRSQGSGAAPPAPPNRAQPGRPCCAGRQAAPAPAQATRQDTHKVSLHASGQSTGSRESRFKHQGKAGEKILHPHGCSALAPPSSTRCPAASLPTWYCWQVIPWCHATPQLAQSCSVQ